MLKKEVSAFEITYQMKQFFKEHPDSYTEEEKRFLLSNSGWGRKTSLVPDTLRQIYDELNLVNPEKNIYIGFLELLESTFPQAGNFTEIGGGRLPRLATRLALKPKTGWVTVYDPKLIEKKGTPSNLLLKKEKFSLSHPIQKNNMMIGFMPCEATELLIEAACRNNLDFMIALCDGENDELLNNELDDAEYDWQSRMICEARKMVRDHDLGTLEITNLEKYDDPYPVIYNKRK